MEKSNKPLSDWLIASDIDGTLNNKLRLMPKRNYKAIQKFVYDFGGNFILASGRSIESMRYHYKKLNLKSGYAVFTNGAGVYDYDNEKILWLCPMKENLVDVVKAIAEKHKFAKVQIVKPTEVCLVKPDIAAYFLAWSSKLKIKKFKSMGFDAIQFHDDDAVPNINDYTEEEILYLLDLAEDLKEKKKQVVFLTKLKR